MITRIEVDGFKSLTTFNLDFVPGLNILVGPNGSGKTNIVSFFEFLGHLMETEASEATSRVGGAGAVFRRIGTDYEKRIRARLIGCVRYFDEHHPRRKSKQENLAYCLYDYSFSLVFPDTRDKVFFEKQRLSLKQVKQFITADKVEMDRERWDADIESEISSDGSPIVKVKAYRDSVLDLPYYLAPSTQKAQRDQAIEQTLTQILASNVSLASVVCRYSHQLSPVVNDLSGGQIYNIVPSRVKLPEDSAKPPGIARDGSGLAATLYALQRVTYPEHFGPWSRFYWSPREQLVSSSLSELKQYLQLVNTAIEDIEVSNDPFDNQLRVRFHIRSGEYTAVLPMGLMSDGTLKWIAVVTAALTARSVFCIEEPENYLHPQMQGEIVNILRDILFRQEADRFTLMTTHSETLLNHCRPHELIIISMSDGKTVAKRCSQPAEISEEIRRTGFGLGYYYTSNALQND